MNDHAFAAMGCSLRILGADDPDALEAEVHEYAARLTRFEPDSELSMLNDDPRLVVPASLELCAAVAAALFAAEMTGGLVDPTLGAEMVDAGYVDSIGVPADLGDALRAAPMRYSARGRDRWRAVRVLAGRIIRPPGIRFDLGGTAKGLLADLLIDRAEVVDCAGDIRIRTDEPVAVEVIHPLTHEPAVVLHMSEGGIATSGIDRRSWRNEDGTYGHHLLDPSTGRPAWTGLIGATALAPTAFEAEVRAKAAVLSGPTRGREWLQPHGGFLFHDDGRVEDL